MCLCAAALVYDREPTLYIVQNNDNNNNKISCGGSISKTCTQNDAQTYLLFCITTDYNDEISNRLIYDEERKYGEIPTEIYMLYLKSCGLWMIIVFCVSAIAWQAMKIYADVWLRAWTDVDEVHRFHKVCKPKPVAQGASSRTDTHTTFFQYTSTLLL